jgi:hypothetical protein
MNHTFDSFKPYPNEGHGKLQQTPGYDLTHGGQVLMMYSSANYDAGSYFNRGGVATVGNKGASLKGDGIE